MNRNLRKDDAVAGGKRLYPSCRRSKDGRKKLLKNKNIKKLLTKKQHEIDTICASRVSSLDRALSFLQIKNLPSAVK